MTTDPTDAIHVQILLDRSGSMNHIAAATVDAVNGFLAKQRKVPGMLRLSLADFQSSEPFRILIDAVPIAEVLDLRASDYRPRGGTPLLDAIGTAVDRLDVRVQADADEDQVLVIVTDGLENASTDRTANEIAALLDARQEGGWSVLFLGANQDAFAESAKISAKRGNTRTFAATDKGIDDALHLAADAVLDLRAAPREQRQALKDDVFDRTDER